MADRNPDGWVKMKHKKSGKVVRVHPEAWANTWSKKGGYEKVSEETPLGAPEPASVEETVVVPAPAEPEAEGQLFGRNNKPKEV